MDEMLERRYLEGALLAGQAKPPLGRTATVGRLCELYLQGPETRGIAAHALELLRIALSEVAPSDPLYPKLRHLESKALRLLPEPEPNSLGVHGAAAEAAREAWRLSLEIAPGEAIAFARDWADWAWERDLWEEAAEAYSNAHRALRRFLLRQVVSENERLELLEFTPFATRAAYAYAKLENPKEAIIQLERASDLMFGLQGQTRDMKRLTMEHPEISKRLEDAQSKRRRYGKSAKEKFGLDQFGNLPATARQAQAALDVIVREIRTLPGFSTFALPSNWDDVQAAAIAAPLVYLVPTDKGTAGLIVFHEHDKLSNVGMIMFKDTVREIHAAAKRFTDAEFGAQPLDSQSDLLDLLGWLGLHLMMHVRAVLGERGRGDNPVTIVPFGILTFLPLHATFIHPDDPRHFHFLFHPGNVAFAYWARGLVECQRRSTEAKVDRALTINNPKPLVPTFDLLLLSDFEAAVVAKYFTGAVLTGAAATSKRVSAALPDAWLIHFSCHGAAAREFKYSGTLALANKEAFTYLHIRAQERIAARLVVLSACRGGSSAPSIEHVLSLPAAFLAAGAAAVLGTFWHADEMATLLLITKFYELWQCGAASPARALGDAQAWLMTASPAALRAVLPPGALNSPAAQELLAAPEDSRPYVHPWYWADFFLAGA